MRASPARQGGRYDRKVRDRRVLRASALLVALTALPICAQEPLPLRLVGSYLKDPDGVALDFAWRFATGGAPGRNASDYDDRDWYPVRPLMTPGELPPGGWTGVGWFRRHLIVESSLQRTTIALRLVAPGAADVYLDGQLVLSLGDGGGAPPEIPSERRGSCLVTFEGFRHVLALRYVYPKGAPPFYPGIGFRLSLANPALARGAATRGLWIAGMEGALAALPLFLALLHFTLFAFYPRARENLFYAIEMAAFTLILLQEYHDNLLATEAQRQLLDRLSLGAPVIAIVFGLLTYYAVRTDPFPRTWRAFVGAGLLLFPVEYLGPNAREIVLDVFFFAVVVEVVRLERSRRTVRRQGARFFLASFAVFGLTIVLQILVNNGLLQSVAGVRAVYIFGVLASAVGMSLYLAHALGQSRVLEAEDARKTLELAQARELQLSMLPRELPQVAGLDVAAATQTAAEVGGDYYDARPGDNGSLLVAFGDATGHGMASGVVVTAAKVLFTSLPTNGPLPGLLAECDRVLRGMRLPGFQMCLAIARISPREAMVVSAGMPPVLIHRAQTNVVEELGAGGLPLGSRLPAVYEERRASLDLGDTLLFASDGFAELLGPEGAQLGYTAAAATFREVAKSGSAYEVVDRLVAATAAFRGTRLQDDDITFTVVRVVS